MNDRYKNLAVVISLLSACLVLYHTTIIKDISLENSNAFTTVLFSTWLLIWGLYR